MSYLKLIIISIFTLGLGVLLFLFHNNWIIVLPKPQVVEQSSEKIQKTVILFFPHGEDLKKENHVLLWSAIPTSALQQLLTEWFTCMQQENTLTKKITVQSTALNAHGTEAYISLDISPFTKQQSTAAKLLIIEAFLKTIQANIPTLQTVMLLINQAPFEDPHIDFAQPLPIHGYIDAQPDFTPKKIPHKASFTLVLDTATQRTKGRTIDDAFERALATQTAHLLKKNLTEVLPITIYIPRITQELEPFQHTTYTNKLGTNLVISLHFYHQNTPLPHCAIYYYMHNATIDFWQQRKSPLMLELYSNAYRQSINESFAYATQVYNQLLPTTNMLTCTVLGIPYKPLKGITKPAIALEIGIKESADIQKVVPLIAQAIIATLC